MYVCLWSPAWSTGGELGGEGIEIEERERERERERGGEVSPAELAPLLAGLSPRLRVERERIWADGRGLDAGRLAADLVGRLGDLGVASRAGVAAVPVVAQLAARWGSPSAAGEGGTPFLVKERTGWGWRRSLRPASTGSPAVSGLPGGSRPSGGGSGASGGEAGVGGEGAEEAGESEGVAVVSAGEEKRWLAELPVTVLEPDGRLRSLLDGVGIQTLGSLAALERESVEVRLGPAAVELWRLARGDDRRLLFDRIPPERPHGSLDFVDYVLTDPSRLLFTANALLGPLCDGLAGRGEHARALRLTLPLGNGESWERTLRPARPTASRDTWLRLIRGLLDELTVPDAVAGMRIEVGATEEAAVRQGDLFDRGFATAAAVEAAVARLAERHLHPLVPDADAHPLVERRGRWIEDRGSRSSLPSAPPRSGGERGLALQLLESPRRVVVEAVARRDHEVPVRVRAPRGWFDVTLAAGPDRISGGQWERETYAREYFRCITEAGVQLWVYRDALDGAWYLHGWWD